MSSDDLGAFIRDHVDRFNVGVRTGDFGPMLEHFTDDAELVFEGVPAGPFHGREAIATAYRFRPPDEEIDVLGYRQDGDEIACRYVWAGRRGAPGGEMRITRAGNEIRRMVVTFDQAAE